MKRKPLYFVVAAFAVPVFGIMPLKAQKLAAKTNFLYWASTTPNLSLEAGLGRKSTFELQGGYNPFSFGSKEDNKKLKHWLVQGEYRHWLCESFNGHFFGVHGLYSKYNTGGYNLDFLFGSGSGDSRYEGDTFGGGVSYGYNLMLSRRWNLEITGGIGFSVMKYDRFECIHCGEKQESDVKRNYFGPTKLGLSIVYLIN